MKVTKAGPAGTTAEPRANEGPRPSAHLKQPVCALLAFRTACQALPFTLTAAAGTIAEYCYTLHAGSTACPRILVSSLSVLTGHLPVVVRAICI